MHEVRAHSISDERLPYSRKGSDNNADTAFCRICHKRTSWGKPYCFPEHLHLNEHAARVLAELAEGVDKEQDRQLAEENKRG